MRKNIFFRGLFCGKSKLFACLNKIHGELKSHKSYIKKLSYQILHILWQKEMLNKIKCNTQDRGRVNFVKKVPVGCNRM